MSVTSQANADKLYNDAAPADPAAAKPADQGTQPPPADPAVVTDNTTPTEPAADPAVDPTKDAPKADDKPSEYKLTLSEGSPLTAEHLAEVAEYAKAKGFTPEQAQAMVEREEQVAKKFETNWKQTQERAAFEEWPAQAKADKEIGGKNFDQSLALSKRALNKYGTPEFVNVLETTGIGNHPEVIRIFKKIGEAMADDTAVLPTNNSSGKQKSVEERFYGAEEK